MKKNVASQLVCAQMISTTDGSNVTSGTCNVAVELDGTAGTGGTATHIANGKWEYAPIQADTNGDHVAFQFVLSGAVTQMVQVYTTFPQTGDNFARIGAPAGASVSADVAAAQTDLNTLTDTGVVLADSASHGGSSTVITADHIIISSATNDAISVTASGVGDDALKLDATGAGGYGLRAEGNNSTGVGLYAFGELTGVVMANTAASAGNGLSIIGNGTGVGMSVSGTTGEGLEVDSSGSTAFGTSLAAALQSEANDALVAYDPPTEAEMNARTLAAAAYFNPAADTVASVTTVATLTGHTAQTGDSFARLGAPAGASVSADVAAAQTDLDTLTDARGEPAQGAPAVSTTMLEKIDYLYKAWRNRSTQTATTYSLYADNATTVDHKATVSDDATTADKGEVATGP